MKTDLTKVVRKYCLECCNHQPYEVAKCTCQACPLYNFRDGKKHGKISVLPFVKMKCKDCMEKPVDCEFLDCPLHPYRVD